MAGGRVPGYRPRFASKPWGPRAGARLDKVLRRVADAVAVLQGRPVMATDVDFTAGAIGVSKTPAPDDHKHELTIPSTAGGLIVNAGVPAELAVGTDGQVLMADSAQAAKMRWADMNTDDAELLAWMAMDP